MPLQVCSPDSAFSWLTKSTCLPALPFLISQRYPSFDSIMTNNKQMISTCRRQSRANRRKGATAVEFALVVPLVFLMVFGLLEISRAVTLTDTARTSVIAGAREANVALTTSDNVEEEMNAILDLFQVRTRTVTVSPAVIDATVDEVTISVEVPLTTDNGLFMGMFGSNPVRFTNVVER